MRREGEQAQQPKRAAPSGPAKYPRLHSDGNGDDEIDATREWLAHIAAGRIEVK